MPRRGEPLRKLGFLTIGRFDVDDPGPGIEETLQVITRAEALGFDSVWLRCRHFQPGISSPVAIMAAATQRTSRIELGTAVIPLLRTSPAHTKSQVRGSQTACRSMGDRDSLKLAVRRGPPAPANNRGTKRGIS